MTTMSVKIPQGMYHKRRKLELHLKDLVPNQQIFSELFYHRDSPREHQQFHPNRKEAILGGREKGRKTYTNEGSLTTRAEAP